MSFQDAVRQLARREGYEVADDTPVDVKMTGEWSGYSEFTITNQWDAFTVTCGPWTKTYDTEEESRHYCHDQSWQENMDDKDCQHYARGPGAALAKLFDDLKVEAL